MSTNSTTAYQVAAPAMSIPAKTARLRPTAQATTKPADLMAPSPSPVMYLVIFGAWLASLIWFQPRLLMLLDMAYNLPSRIALWTFIGFIDFAWLYGMYNLGVVLFAVFYQISKAPPPSPSCTPPATISWRRASAPVCSRTTQTTRCTFWTTLRSKPSKNAWTLLLRNTLVW